MLSYIWNKVDWKWQNKILANVDKRVTSVSNTNYGNVFLRERERDVNAIHIAKMSIHFKCYICNFAVGLQKYSKATNVLVYIIHNLYLLTLY